MSAGTNRFKVRTLIDQFGLSLSGLTVYTEAASGSYLLTPVLAAAAGAEHVWAQTRDSRFGRAQDVIDATTAAAQELGVAGRIEFSTSRRRDWLGHCDIVTNSGFVRPIDRDLIVSLKPTAVIPLMWETWEFRPSEFDLRCCKERGILVLGTNEHVPPCDMRGFLGLCSLKLLFELGFDGGKVLFIGSATLVSSPMVERLRGIGINVTWASPDGSGDLGYQDLQEHVRGHGEQYDVIMLAEHKTPTLLLGRGGVLDYSTIMDVNPALKIGIVCGNIDVDGLIKSGLSFMPKEIAGFGFMSYQPSMLGAAPVMTLQAGGLKVGQVMARARIKGLPPKEAAREAMATSPAMDFPGNEAWIADSSG